MSFTLRFDMIQNERQYKITQTKLREFENAIAELKTLPAPTTRNEQLDYQLDFDALTSFVEEFKEEIAEYEKLKQGKTEHLDLDFLEKLPEALIKARIVRGLTQEQLADRLNVKPQQVQRDEANLYASASFHKLLAVQKALNVEIKQEVIFK